MITKDTKKPKQVQGKLDREKLFKLVTQDIPPTKKVMAVEIGSLAKSDEAKIQAVSNAINSSQFQLRLEDFRNKQRERAYRRQKKADGLIDWDQVALNPALAFQIVDKSERLLQESVKQSTDNINEKEKNKSLPNLTITELEVAQKELQEQLDNKKELESIIDGSIVKE